MFGACPIAHNFERDLAHVQHYIQAQLQPEEPNLLCVNAALLEDYREELDHYVKQKQVRRTLPATPSPTNRSEPTRAKQPVHVHAQDKHHAKSERGKTRVRSPERLPSVRRPPPMPKRLPGVQWLLAHHHGFAASLPIAAPTVHRHPSPPVIPVSTHSYHSYPVHHRVLKKQKTL